MFKTLANLFKGKTAAEEATEEGLDSARPDNTDNTTTENTVEETQAGTVADASTAVLADLQGQVVELGDALRQAQGDRTVAETERDTALAELAQFGASVAERTTVLEETKQLYAWYKNSKKLGVLGVSQDASAANTGKEKYESAVSKEARAAREAKASRKKK